MNNFETIQSEDLDTVNGGRGGAAIKKAGSWLWRNVVGPAGGGALYSWAADRLGGGQQQQPAQPPAQQPPAQ